ncbi:progonadoliberin-2 [Enhydra lutris kenyoni]|uniref:Progonadoliberin-2 n=1 Tax=Enhydra lutris kenyoni TaxID=391180 RepID=A0A2Y9ISX4_ENHLU|nr:progonadoliberin-2 [Enhydra lutris kenyoni]
MANRRLGFLLRLLLTVHPGSSKAQHWSHGWYPGGKRASSSAHHPQQVPRLLGRVLGPAASSPDQTAQTLPSDALAPLEKSVPWEGRTTGWWPLHGKQHLVQTLLEATEPAAGSSSWQGHQSGGSVIPRKTRLGGMGADKVAAGLPGDHGISWQDEPLPPAERT